MTRQIRDVLGEAEQLLYDLDPTTEGGARARAVAKELETLLNKLPLPLLTGEMP